MNFPNGFKEKYQHLLGEDAAAFFATFDQEALAAFRTNPLKEAQKYLTIPFLIRLGGTTERSQGNPSSTQQAWSIRKSQQLR